MYTRPRSGRAALPTLAIAVHECVAATQALNVRYFLGFAEQMVTPYNWEVLLFIARCACEAGRKQADC